MSNGCVSPRYFISSLTLMLFLFLVVDGAYASSRYDNSMIKIIKKQLTKNHTPVVKQRLIKWHELIQNNQYQTAEVKIKRVNDFFNDKNLITYANDIFIWKKKDYWATPVEFIIKGYGDCEDYSVAKYYTLKALGVKDEHLRLAYVEMNVSKNGIKSDLAHMVLVYYPKKSAIPLVLDNFNTKVEAAYNRLDLKFLYSFNDGKLYLFKQNAFADCVGNSKLISKWVGLKQKLMN